MSDDKPGPTGEYPDGKLHDNDDGELNIAIAVGINAGCVTVHFNKSITWFAIPADEVSTLCDVLKARAAEAKAAQLQAMKSVN